MELLLYTIIFYSALFLIGRLLSYDGNKKINNEDDLNKYINKYGHRKYISPEERARNVLKKMEESTPFIKEKDESYSDKIDVVSSDKETTYERTKFIEPTYIKKHEINSEEENIFIGYTPNAIFKQTEPISFPYVLMPDNNNIIKIPQNGRSQRKGIKEESFHRILRDNFSNQIDIYDDKRLLSKSGKCYEPDLTLIYNKNGENIFIDIEIDEPYEGLNNIEKREPTHYQYADINRNNAFKNRGWIVIRFAEIQIHNQPFSCCLFIADVIKTICSDFIIPSSIQSVEHVAKVEQWTKEQAITWSAEKYRERYLGILLFNHKIIDNKPNVISETEQGEIVEEIVKDDPFFLPPTSYSKEETIRISLKENTYIGFLFENNFLIIKPKYIIKECLVGYCYTKNCDRKFKICDMHKVVNKQSYFTEKFKNTDVKIDQIRTIISNTIKYDRYLRIIYFDYHGMTTTRTISKVESVSTLPSEDIKYYSLTDDSMFKSYCHLRMGSRVFRFDRIKQIEILNI